MLDEHKNIDFVIQIANQYARENNFFRLAKLVKDTHQLLCNYRDKLDPLVNKAIDYYQNNKES